MIKKLLYTQTWVKDGCNQDIIAKTIYQGINQSSLARTHIASEYQKALVVENGILHHGKGFFMFLPKPEELRVRAYLKRFLNYIIVRQIHGTLLRFLSRYRRVNPLSRNHPPYT